MTDGQRCELRTAARRTKKDDRPVDVLRVIEIGQRVENRKTPSPILSVCLSDCVRAGNFRKLPILAAGG